MHRYGNNHFTFGFKILIIFLGAMLVAIYIDYIILYIISYYLILGNADAIMHLGYLSETSIRFSNSCLNFSLILEQN